MTGEAAHHSVSVAGVVIDENGRTLVIQRRDNGRWEPPGGILERDEPIIEGLLREVREETGLVVDSEAAGFRWVLESEVSAIMPEAFASVFSMLSGMTP